MAQAEQSKDLLANRNKGKRFTSEGRNLSTDQIMRGKVVAKDKEEACRRLQRRGIRPLRVSKVKSARKKYIAQEDITVFTRQLTTMMKVGLSLMQAFEIVAHGHSNPSMTQILMRVRTDMGRGSALGKSFPKYPKYFDCSYYNLASAGGTGGALEGLLDRLAVYKKKTQAIKKKVKTALVYPIVIMVVAVALIFVIMMFVLSALGEVYSSVGAELPGLTRVVMSMSKSPIKYGWVMIAAIILVGFSLYKLHQKSPAFQKRADSIILHLPIFDPIVRKTAIARLSPIRTSEPTRHS